MGNFEVTRERSAEKYHALKEVGRGTEKLVKGAAATISAAAGTVGLGYLDLKGFTYLYLRPLINQWDHTVNNYEIGGLSVVTFFAVLGIYLLGSYGIGKMKEGAEELKKAKR